MAGKRKRNAGPFPTFRRGDPLSSRRMPERLVERCARNDRAREP
jgi:hypothetical protein